jgi:hypothetical protein
VGKNNSVAEKGNKQGYGKTFIGTHRGLNLAQIGELFNPFD